MNTHTKNFILLGLWLAFFTTLSLASIQEDEKNDLFDSLRSKPPTKPPSPFRKPLPPIPITKPPSPFRKPLPPIPITKPPPPPKKTLLNLPKIDDPPPLPITKKNIVFRIKSEDDQPILDYHSLIPQKITFTPKSPSPSLELTSLTKPPTFTPPTKPPTKSPPPLRFTSIAKPPLSHTPIY